MIFLSRRLLPFCVPIPVKKGGLFSALGQSLTWMLGRTY